MSPGHCSLAFPLPPDSNTARIDCSELWIENSKADAMTGRKPVPAQSASSCSTTVPDTPTTPTPGFNLESDLPPPPLQFLPSPPSPRAEAPPSPPLPPPPPLFDCQSQGQQGGRSGGQNGSGLAPSVTSQYAPMRAKQNGGGAVTNTGLYGSILRRRPLSDSVSKPSPPMRRNSSMASGPSSPETPSSARPTVTPMPPAGLLRSVSASSGASTASSGPLEKPPTSPKPRIVPGQPGHRPTVLPMGSSDTGSGSGRRHSSIHSSKNQGDAQISTSALTGLGRKSSFASTTNAPPSSQPAGSCLDELTSVLRQRKQQQEQQQKQQQHTQRLSQQLSQHHYQQPNVHPSLPQSQQQPHHQFRQQYQQPHQQSHPQHHKPPAEVQQQRLHSPNPEPDDGDSLKSALRAQGLRLKPTPFRNDRSAPFFG